MVDAFSDSLHIYLVLVGVALLEVGRRDNFYSYIVYTYALMWLDSSHFLFLFQKVNSKHLGLMEKI